MNYLVARIEAPEGACLLGSLKNVPKSFEIRFGNSRLPGFPADARFLMDEDFPKGIALTDALQNDNRFLVASARLRSCLESIPGALFQNELLPVKIINHKGRQEKALYVIVNQLDHPACLKEKDCDGVKNPINPDRFQSIAKLVLDEKRIDPKLMLFRAAEFPKMPLVRRDLAAKLKAEHFTGISFHEIEGYEF